MFSNTPPQDDLESRLQAVRNWEQVVNAASIDTEKVLQSFPRLGQITTKHWYSGWQTNDGGSPMLLYSEGEGPAFEAFWFRLRSRGVRDMEKTTDGRYRP
jgi:hypothetical protein